MRRSLFVYVVAGAMMMAASPNVFAAPDDGVEAVVSAAQPVEAFQIADNTIDQWIFQGVGGEAQGKDRINRQLKLQLDELAEVCSLSEDQKARLTLAAHGDIKRFFDQVQAVKRKMQVLKNDRNAAGLAWQEAQPLQMKMTTGLFGDSSLFARIVPKTLTPEQSAKYKAIVDDRRKFRYRACILAAVVQLEGQVALRDEQRQKLIELLVDKTRPPKVFGQQNYQVVLYRLASLPKEDLKQIFDDRQWKLLEQPLMQGRSMEQYLVQNGLVEGPAK